MYLQKISITNFRQFGTGDGVTPAITVFFNPNFNILVGENDSGKTAIIDAIRYLLGSVSEDFEKISQNDFYSNSDGVYSDFFYIEGTFVDLTDQEAGSFLEWLSFDENGDYQLRVSLQVEKKKNDNGQEYIERKMQAGDQGFETRLDNKARDILKTTYLKPLRDAENELKPGFRSRLASILKVHPAFKLPEDGSIHKLVDAMEKANEKVESFFEEDYTSGRSLVNDIEGLLRDFYDHADLSKTKSKFSITKTDLISILRKLSLDTVDVNLGLGNQNLLFIATELLLLNNLFDEQQIIGPQITLIEEIEAHLHPQAQIRLIKYLEDELRKSTNRNQFILTSHSTNLVSSIDPKNVILIYEKTAYPLSDEYTMLDKSDYAFLERFLDSTKSNMFFAKGLIFVEGDSELLLLPALADLIGYPLHKNGISLINVSGTSFERYIKLFSRSIKWKVEMNLPSINIPLAIITDSDVKPWSYYKYENKTHDLYLIVDETELSNVLEHCEENIDEISLVPIGKEFSTIKKLARSFGFSLTEANADLISSIVKKDITIESINRISEEKITKLKEKYSIYDSNIGVFVTPEWTLEYSIALSVISPLLLESIFEARYAKPFEGKNKERYDNLVSQLSDDTIEREDTAYMVFKPLNEKNVSKAEVAQRLAIKLNAIAKDNSKRAFWKDSILQDKNLKYLVDAIIHSVKVNELSEVSS
ncbi:AAA family ATPase [Sporosarcina sp. USHLN248]|uniref:ATP-dependent nuclease n=1 Tax=Sporosarcina sp. USHLN248 TaxID=3081300 RepID=UPI0030159564